MIQNILLVGNLGAIWQLILKLISLEGRLGDVERDLDTRLDHIEAALTGLGKSLDNSERQHH